MDWTATITWAIRFTSLLVTFGGRRRTPCSNGYAIQIKKAGVQQAVFDFTTKFTSLLESYEKQNMYPVNSAVEIRVTSLDDPAPASCATTSDVKRSPSSIGSLGAMISPPSVRIGQHNVCFSLGENMSTISTSEEPGARLQDALISWATRLAPAEIQDSRYQAAFDAIDRALVATIRYMEGRKAGKPQDQNHEWQLTQLWMEASRALSPIDDPAVAKVADACTVKGLGWTDPTVWEAAERKGLRIGVQDMQGARMLLNRKRGISVSTSRAPAWFRIACVCAAAVTVLFLMWPGARTSEEE